MSQMFEKETEWNPCDEAMSAGVKFSLMVQRGVGGRSR